jgi:hypothetical protein
MDGIKRGEMSDLEGNSKLSSGDYSKSLCKK